jgi:hypothetical protein
MFDGRFVQVQNGMFGWIKNNEQRVNPLHYNLFIPFDKFKIKQLYQCTLKDATTKLNKS